ncbi:extracellular solute-binding protein [Lapidilactobacillus achengensis]|uniref:Maltodextrin-binding protein n=1 Tax=Lapidilactobacillus achengensis TaxID=2486000 RepID=A0ABW1UM14_9LACO|nr:extracellular solute-binding protein [Lapidilactobacillus achengensis]
MNLKKWRYVGLAALTATVALSLAACGNSSSSDKKSATSSESKTLTISVDKGYKKYVNKIKGKFEKDNNVKIKMVNKDMLDQLDALQLDGPAGKAPDVMMAPFDRVGGLAQQGQVAEYNPVSGRYASTGEDAVKYDGKHYGAPVTIESIVMYYNKKLIDKAPTTFDEIEAISKDSKFAYENDKTKNVGFLAQWTNFYISYGVFKGYGGYVFGDDNSNPKKIGLNNAGSVEALDFMTNYFKNVWPKGMQDIKANQNFIDDQFTKGKTAVVIDGPWKASSYKEAGIDYGATVLPTLPNGKDYQAFGGGKSWVISAYSKNQSLAKKWLDYVSNDANQKTFFNMTAEIPANLKAQNAAKEDGTELTTAVIEQFKKDDPLINLPEMSEVWDAGQTIVTNAASGKMTSKEAADAGVKVIKQKIEQKYGSK